MQSAEILSLDTGSHESWEKIHWMRYSNQSRKRQKRGGREGGERFSSKNRNSETPTLEKVSSLGRRPFKKSKRVGRAPAGENLLLGQDSGRRERNL